MSKKIVVLIIHGMGSQNNNYADEMIKILNTKISRLSKNPDMVAWKPIFWADVLESKQNKYLKEIKENHKTKLMFLRKFILQSLGDATAYQKVMSNKDDTYEKIHQRIYGQINETYKVDLEEKSCPLIIMAHSLGAHIMSNYIWDMQQSNDTTVSAFEKMNHLAGMVTFGCNIPVFTFAYDNVEPIKFPGEGLSDEIKSLARWDNYYDPQDILGFPLKAINSGYANVVDNDIPINVGGLFSSWNPICHNKYWTDSDFTKPVAKFISTFL